LVYKNKLYFSAITPEYGRELWTSDGTEAGTKLVKDIYSGSTTSQIQKLKVLNNLLYFQANDGVNGAELWVTDGTLANTALAVDINPGISSSNPEDFVLLGDKMYIIANDGVHGIELHAYQADALTSLVAQAKNSLKMTFYPVPTTDVLHIKVDRKIQAQITVTFYNVFGQAILSEKVTAQNNTFSINIANLPAGKYICQVAWGNELIARKILKY
jgi:ELWxxDGT repeat protein